MYLVTQSGISSEILILSYNNHYDSVSAGNVWKNMISSAIMVDAVLTWPSSSFTSPQDSLPVIYTLWPFFKNLQTVSRRPGLNTLILCQSVLCSMSPDSYLQLKWVARGKFTTGCSSVPLFCGSAPTLPSRVT